MWLVSQIFSYRSGWNLGSSKDNCSWWLGDILAALQFFKNQPCLHVFKVTHLKTEQGI